VTAETHPLQAAMTRAMQSSEPDVAAAATSLTRSVLDTMYPYAAGAQARVASRRETAACRRKDDRAAQRAAPWTAASTVLHEYVAQHLPDVATVHTCAQRAWARLLAESSPVACMRNAADDLANSGSKDDGASMRAADDQAASHHAVSSIIQRECSDAEAAALTLLQVWRGCFGPSVHQMCTVLMAHA
jgi:hypothetical protein